MTAANNKTHTVKGKEKKEKEKTHITFVFVHTVGIFFPVSLHGDFFIGVLLRKVYFRYVICYAILFTSSF